jgi:hypothetical protein
MFFTIKRLQLLKLLNFSQSANCPGKYCLHWAKESGF